MPLYMDFHKIPGITNEDAKKAHTADEKIQRQYGVKYLQFWVNEQAGTVFCLVEGPDKATCENVHRMAHGHLPCAMVELDPSYYALVMGEHMRLDGGLVQDANGAIDLGYRTIMAVHFNFAGKKNSKDSEGARIPPALRQKAMDHISKQHGRVVKVSGEESVLSAFNSADQALACAKNIRTELLAYQKNQKKSEDKFSFTIGIGAGQPLNENSEFMEDAVKLARRLSYVANPESITISALVKELSDEASTSQQKFVKFLNESKENFLTQLFNILEARIADEKLSIENLSEEVGISRPQLYRKVVDLAGKSPNDLIRDLRLDKAFSLLKRKGSNISEIAFMVGFSSPSYFAKCFSKKFGYLPSALASQAV